MLHFSCVLYTKLCPVNHYDHYEWLDFATYELLFYPCLIYNYPYPTSAILCDSAADCINDLTACPFTVAFMMYTFVACTLFTVQPKTTQILLSQWCRCGLTIKYNSFSHYSDKYTVLCHPIRQTKVCIYIHVHVHKYMYM